MFANPDLVRWENKYRSGTNPLPVEPKGEAELVAWFFRQQGPGKKTSGLAMDVACGRGANALYLASLGYKVVAVDGALAGVKSCQWSASHYALAVHPVVMDLQQAVLPQGQFDFISVIRYLERSLITPLVDVLAPGGLLFFKTFNQRFLEQKPHFPAEYVLKTGELSSWFKGWDVLATNEFGEDSSSFILVRKPV